MEIVAAVYLGVLAGVALETARYVRTQREFAKQNAIIAELEEWGQDVIDFLDAMEAEDEPGDGVQSDNG
jgi:hypothetical protein